MKKIYKKPNISIELFSLTQNIARNCGVPHVGNDYGVHQFGDENSCCWYDYVDRIWFIENSICDVSPEDSSLICYNNPNNDTVVFAS